MHFSLLWSYFEATALDERASPNKIERWIRSLNCDLRSDTVVFETALDYFKKRYFQREAFTDQFESLNLAPQNIDFVKGVVSGNNAQSEDCLVALFFIIHRIRNNFFHGPKWADHLVDQRLNFTHANASLMAIMDIARKAD